MELTDVDFSVQKFHWLFENNETDQGTSLTAFGYFKEMNIFFSIFTLHLDDCCGLSIFCLEMSETCELLSWYLRGCNMIQNAWFTT